MGLDPITAQISLQIKQLGERLLEQWLEIRSDGEGTGQGAGRNQKRTGNRQADTIDTEAEDVVNDEVGLFTGKLMVEGWLDDREPTIEAGRGRSRQVRSTGKASRIRSGTGKDNVSSRRIYTELIFDGAARWRSV